jgi:hypothetical protein
MTKEEFFEYQANQKRNAAHERIQNLATYGHCRSLTDEEWDATDEKGKSRFKVKITGNEHWKD